MTRFVLRRLSVLVPTFFFIVVISFGLTELLPGDPAVYLAGENASPNAVAAVRERLYLDEPLLGRLWTYLSDLVRGDLGESFVTSRPVLDAIVEVLPVTASIGAIALLVALLGAVPLGLFAASRRGSWLDRAISASAAITLAVPSFVIALLLVVPLGVNRHLFPATGYRPIGDGAGTWLRHIVLPAVALSLPSMAELVRQVRGAVIDVREQDYIRSCDASGLSRRVVTAKHVLKNAAIPIVTVLGLQIGRVLSGAVVIESVFALPGFGSLAYSAVRSRDLPMIQGVVVVSGGLILVLNTLVDASYGYFNPRLRKA